ncbi:MAG: UDP-glucose 4-epimerase [Acidobacteria bacterium]|nr:MAG: UDP-glucose 4-epimerase [Acidobacteriota bacterium]
MTAIKTVLVTGGAGYVGAVLVPRLLARGFHVKVLDLYIFGDHVLDSVKENPNLEQIKGDIRNRQLLRKILPGVDAVIHLACISNDPSFELDPELGRTINFDCFPDLVAISKNSGVKRFVYASSSSVYGIKGDLEVTEDLPVQPLTDYSKYKALCEDILLKESSRDFVALVLRPATVCGYSPRLRLDLTVNILTNHAVTNRKITVFGGKQMRPNIHIEDVCDLYAQSLEWTDNAINGKIYNAGYENYTVSEVADMVRAVIGPQVEIVTTPTDDNRSYHISSQKIRRDLGFQPRRTVEDAIRNLNSAFAAGLIPDPIGNRLYYNIKTMQAWANELKALVG